MLQFGDARLFQARRASAERFGNAQLCRQFQHRLGPVAAEEMQPQPLGLECLHRRQSIGAHRVGKDEKAQQFCAFREAHRRGIRRNIRKINTHKRGVSEHECAAFDDARHTPARVSAKVLNGRQNQALGGVANALGEGMLRIPLQGRGQAQHIGPVIRKDAGLPQDRLAEGERAGLVEGDIRDGTQPLEGCGISHQQAVSGCGAQRRGQRYGRGESQRTGTGDDQHRDRGSPGQ